MGTSFVAVGTHCPLCDTSVTSVSRGGRVLVEDIHPIALGEGGRGYTLCDECGVLADLPNNLTLN